MPRGVCVCVCVCIVGRQTAGAAGTRSAHRQLPEGISATTLTTAKRQEKEEEAVLGLRGIGKRNLYLRYWEGGGGS